LPIVGVDTVTKTTYIDSGFLTTMFRVPELQMPSIANLPVLLYCAKHNPAKAQEHYAIANQMFTQLGAEGEWRILNEEWRGGGKDEV